MITKVVCGKYRAKVARKEDICVRVIRAGDVGRALDMNEVLGL